MSDLMALDIEQVARQNNEQVVVTASDFNDGNLKSPQHMVLRADDSSKEICLELNVENVDKHNEYESVVVQGEGVCSESNLY
ncbi:hypothetical protein V6N13_030005 [Hibiscus sabdariffa]